MTADKIIEELKLIPHPKEGGYFQEIYRSDEEIPGSALPQRYYGDNRSVSTAIYFLLRGNTYSHFHRLESDEVFHFYDGMPLEIITLLPDGTGQSLILGRDLEKGERPLIVVPRGVWQALRLYDGGKGQSEDDYSLFGTTVAPGFHYGDYEHGNRESLIAEYPEYKADIELLTSR